MTARFSEVNMVLGYRHQPRTAQQTSGDDVYRDTDEPGEGIESSAPGAEASAGERTTPTMINVNAIRSFYRRQDDRGGSGHTGTRIYFLDGGHIRVTDTIDTVMGLVGGGQVG